MNDKDSMTPRDLERIVIETLKISRENREMLEKISNRQRQSRFFSVMKWILGIAVLVIVAYFVYPYLSQIKSTISSVSSQVSTIANLGK